MKTLIHSGKVGLEGLKWEDRAEQPAGPSEIKIKVKAAGLNHRDLFALSQVHEKHPVVIGSDAAGVVVAVGAEVTRFKIGDEVMLYPGSGWRKNSDTAPETFTILGSSEQGAMAEEIVVSEENAVHKPAHLSWEEAGVLSLSALTAYRALFTKGGVSEGMKVLIPGIGGGVANYLLQFAKAAGAIVYVTSRSQEKLGMALQHGAEKGLLHDEDWVEGIGGKVDVVIESVGAATFDKSLDAVRRGGTIVTFGSSTGDLVTFDLRKFFYGQYTLKGSTMGSFEEYEAMIRFVEDHDLHPVVDAVYPAEEFREAFQRLENAEQTGKIALQIG
ncbi:zinc-binding dehydrogenase [Trichococcus shcherbakoviae subsp. psychrophilus]|uniref:Zinc-binding dehydrogenase n=1 Tax=Trichococcus shcherbakoviae subsp. psychrophilus TaxID=2585775 RepID=A0A5C5E773_9LACT|nr:zinc-binding dehydrogenase [Trichococcus shcherbakoviae subsp. psychrophilus]